MKRIMLLTALATFLSVANLSQAQPYAWVDRTPTIGPSARWLHAMAYDSRRGVTVLHGGNPADSQTWEWDGATWTQRFPAHSPPRVAAHAMAYDEARGVTILFGGNASNPVRVSSDTWAWDGSDWTHLQPTHHPPARREFQMTYDSLRQTIVLFGGYSGSSEYSDTWAWDGSNWTEITPLQSPSRRANHGLSFDSTRSQVLMFGGEYFTSLDETWIFDGSHWSRQNPAISPSTRETSAMAFSPLLQATILFGGGDRHIHLGYDDTWRWDGASWDQLHTNGSPPGRFGGQMVYDSGRNRFVLFGGLPCNNGCTELGDTWELILQPSSYATYRTSCVSGTGALAVLTALDLPRVGQPLHLQVTGLSPFKLGMLLLGFQDQYWGANALPLDLTAFGATGCFMNTDPFLIFPVPSNSGGVAEPILPIPQDPIALGVQFFNQFVSFDDAPPSRPNRITTTNAGRGIVGF